MLIRGKEDSKLSARLGAVHPLPGVRAGSGLLRVGKRLLAVQDDAWSAVWISLPSLKLKPLVLRGDGAALPKKDKPDFEAALSTPDGRIHLLGSGSRRNRRWIASIDTGGSVRVQERKAIYRRVRKVLELVERPNIEGASIAGDRLRLFHRGAGGAASAMVELPLAVLDGAKPAALDTLWMNVGRIDGVALSITDVAALDERRTLFLAAAERTDDAVSDGEIAGSAIGLLEQNGKRFRLRWTRLRDINGRASRRKIEGVAVDADCKAAWLITDQDDPLQPAELCRVTLKGFSAPASV